MRRVIAIVLVWLALLGLATAAPFGPAPQMRGARGDEVKQPTAAPIPVQLDGTRARAGSVTVVAEVGMESLAAELASHAARALEDISADLINGLPRPGAIEVRLVRDASSLASVAPPGRGAPPWAIGVAYPDLGIVSVATRRGGSYVDPIATLRHELAHLALGAALGDKAPRWLHEGFAYQHSAEASFDRTETLAGMVWFDGIVPLAELERSFPAEESPAHRAYVQSYDFVGYLSRRGRWEDRDDDGDRWPFRRFLASVGAGVPMDVAARKEFGGKSMAQLFEEWEGSLKDRMVMAPIGLLGLAAWMLAAVLLGLAWRRRRRQNRARIALWDVEERRRDQEEQARKAELAARLAAISFVTPPAFKALDGQDPRDDEPDDVDPRDPDRLLN